jgi:hypothetical protein
VTCCPILSKNLLNLSEADFGREFRPESRFAALRDGWTAVDGTVRSPAAAGLRSWPPCRFPFSSGAMRQHGALKLFHFV